MKLLHLCDGVLGVLGLCRWVKKFALAASRCILRMFLEAELNPLMTIHFVFPRVQIRGMS